MRRSQLPHRDARGGRGHRGATARRREWPFLGYIAPAVIVLLLFRYVPLAYGGYVSLWDFSLLGGFREFVGLGNYASALTDSRVHDALLVTTKYSVAKVSIELALGLGLALLLQGTSLVRKIMRSVVFVPAVTSVVVVSVVWSLIYNTQFGLANGMLTSLGLAPVPFLTDSRYALMSIVLMAIWNSVGLTTIIFTAALGLIPEELYDAASVDGANKLRRFWHVTLPGMRGPMLFVTAMLLIDALQVFVPMYAMTDGGPQGSTTSIGLYIYERAFVFGSLGYASAVSLLLVFAVLLITFAVMATRASSDRRERRK